MGKQVPQSLLQQIADGKKYEIEHDAFNNFKRDEPPTPPAPTLQPRAMFPYSLQQGGHYIINICKEVYDNVLKGLFGEAHEIFPLKKSKRQNEYTEMVYVWVKN